MLCLVPSSRGNDSSTSKTVEKRRPSVRDAPFRVCPCDFAREPTSWLGMSKTRRELLRDIFVVLPVGWVLVQAGCASNSSDDCADANKLVATATAITVTSVCNEHTHDFTIMKTDLATPPAAGVMGNTSAYADDGHVHSLALTMADLANIEAGMTITKTSGSALGHTHDFNFRLSA